MNYQPPTASDVNKDGNEVPQQAPQPLTTNETGGHGGGQQPITVHFKENSGFEVSFKMKPITKFRKAMEAFAGRTEKKKESMRFIFEGERVFDDMTPGDLSLEDGDIIEVYQEQIGGRVWGA